MSRDDVSLIPLNDHLGMEVAGVDRVAGAMVRACLWFSPALVESVRFDRAVETAGQGYYVGRSADDVSDQRR